jgi:hypothetical protein
MARLDRCGWRAALLLLVALAPGCSPSSFYFFLPENRTPAGMKELAGEDKMKEVRVVILTYSNKLETRPELLGAERDLTQQFAKRLQEGCRDNGENVVIVNPRRVEDFKTGHPNWADSDLADVGKHFKADYVIYLEINKLSFFDPSNLNLLYNGQAHILVSLVNVNNPDVPPERRDFICSYPSEAKAIPVDDQNPPSHFRELFFAHIARKLAWYFTEHLPREEYVSD